MRLNRLTIQHVLNEVTAFFLPMKPMALMSVSQRPKYILEKRENPWCNSVIFVQLLEKVWDPTFRLKEQSPRRNFRLSQTKPEV